MIHTGHRCDSCESTDPGVEPTQHCVNVKEDESGPRFLCCLMKVRVRLHGSPIKRVPKLTFVFQFIWTSKEAYSACKKPTLACKTGCDRDSNPGPDKKNHFCSLFPGFFTFCKIHFLHIRKWNL